MKRFELNEFHSSLQEEFQKLDFLMESFQSEFKDAILLLAKKNYPKTIFPEDLHQAVLSYAIHIFNTAESVSDKDKNYNESRLADEVRIMGGVVENFSKVPKNNLEFANQIHQKAKEILIAFHPELMDLSANGFRLLERYCRLYNKFFMDDFSVMDI